MKKIIAFLYALGIALTFLIGIPLVLFGVPIIAAIVGTGLMGILCIAAAVIAGILVYEEKK